MARLTPKILNLSDNERYQLQQLINKHNTPQQIALRAKIILMASDGQNHREIGRSLDINRQMARLWRNRWLETDAKDLSIFQRLQDMERVGAIEPTCGDSTTESDFIQHIRRTVESDPTASHLAFNYGLFEPPSVRIVSLLCCTTRRFRH